MHFDTVRNGLLESSETELTEINRAQYNPATSPVIRLRRIAVSTIMSLAFVTLPLVAATRTWTGAASALWSNPANWDGGVPNAGDDLVFPRPSSGQTVSTNDLTSGTMFHSITVSGEGYRIAGNGIVLGAGGLILNARFLVSLIHGELKFSSITLAESQTWKGQGNEFTLLGPTNLNGKTLTITSGVRPECESISGTGAIIENAAGGYFSAGSSSYTGTLTVNAGAAMLIGGTAGAVQVNASGAGGDAQVNGQNASLELSGANVANLAVNGSGALSIHGNSGTSSVAGNLIFQAASGDPAWFVIPDGTIPVAINVNGTVKLGNALLVVRTNQAPFVLIHNQGAGPITGTFLGLPEGTIFGNGSWVRISYAGGGGHDVTLTPVSTPVTGTVTTLNASILPASPGEIVSFTATVTSTAGTPAGNVSFYDGGILLGTSTLSATGQATLTTTYERRSHLYTAAYLASDTLAASQGTVRIACDPPAVTQQPASQSILAGQSVSLTVRGGPAPLSYQWYRGQSGDTSSPIENATSATLTLGALTKTSSFWVQLSNDCGSVPSDTATITIQQPRRRPANH